MYDKDMATSHLYLKYKKIISIKIPSNFRKHFCWLMLQVMLQNSKQNYLYLLCCFQYFILLMVKNVQLTFQLNFSLVPGHLPFFMKLYQTHTETLTKHITKVCIYIFLFNPHNNPWGHYILILWKKEAKSKRFKKVTCLRSQRQKMRSQDFNLSRYPPIHP